MAGCECPRFKHTMVYWTDEGRWVIYGADFEGDTDAEEVFFCAFCGNKLTPPRSKLTEEAEGVSPKS